MNKFLISTTEVYRVDTDIEAEALINEAKADSNYILTKYNCQQKELKQKGEIVDSWYRVTLVKEFNSEKEPVAAFDIEYARGSQNRSAF